MNVGSQFKLQILFDNKVIALFRPKRTSREYQAPPNQVHIAEYERHTSEIAAFHLDRFVVINDLTIESLLPYFIIIIIVVVIYLIVYVSTQTEFWAFTAHCQLLDDMST